MQYLRQQKAFHRAVYSRRIENQMLPLSQAWTYLEGPGQSGRFLRHAATRAADHQPTNSSRPATVISNAEAQFALCTRFAHLHQTLVLLSLIPFFLCSIPHLPLKSERRWRRSAISWCSKAWPAHESCTCTMSKMLVSCASPHRNNMLLLHIRANPKLQSGDCFI